MAEKDRDSRIPTNPTLSPEYVQQRDLAASFNDKGLYISADDNGKPGLFMADPNNPSARIPAYLYVAPDGVNFYPSANLDEVKDLYNKDFKNNPAYESAVLSKLKLPKGANETTKLTALNKYIIDYGIDTVAKYKNDPSKTTFTPLDKWSGTATGASQTTVRRALSTKEQAGQELDDFFFEQIGRKATAQEKKDFYARLNKEEKAAKVTTTTTGTGSSTQVGRGMTDADRMRVMSDVLKPAANAMTGAQLVQSGGKIGAYISTLQATARDYGMTYSPDLAKASILGQYQAGGTLTTGSLDAEKLAIKNMAKTFYPNLAATIDSGVKVSAIADQYAYYMGQTLELPDNAIDITRDNHIQNALKNNGKEGAMNLNDFQISLRKDPRWAKTKNAREEAASYANSILASFGLVR